MRVKGSSKLMRLNLNSMCSTSKLYFSATPTKTTTLYDKHPQMFMSSKRETLTCIKIVGADRVYAIASGCDLNLCLSWKESM